MKSNAQPIVAILVAMGLVWAVDVIVPVDLTRLGLVPRTFRGLIGIPLMPFLHGGIGHLFANVIPLAVLLVLMVATRHRAWPAVIAITLLGGGLLWVVGRGANHVGASSLVFGLITYLIVVGFRERQIKSMAVSVLVGFVFGGTLLWGIIPSFGGTISWDGHLCGAIAGVVVGSWSTRNNKRFMKD